jgi:DNA-binding CsgD family transcriptional regulator
MHALERDAAHGGAPSAANDPEPTITFSRREIDCLALLVKGLTDAEIAAHLQIKHATVRFHLDGARRKTSARSRTHLAALVVALGVASP